MLLSLVVIGCASAPKKPAGLTGLEKENAALKTENQTLQSKLYALSKASQPSNPNYDALVNKLQNEVNQGQLTVTQYKDMLKVEIAERIFFDEGSAKLKESGKEVLKKLGESVKTMDGTMIRVIGHTDNVPIKPDWQKYFATNWELSTLRSTTVVRYLQEEAGIPADRLVAVGRGENDAVASNDTDAGRRQNRRIEIGLVDKELESRLGEIGSVQIQQHPQ